MSKFYICPRLQNNHERIILFFRDMLEDHGYKWIKKEYDQWKYNQKISKEYRYLLCILLSIARWEHTLKTGKGPGTTEPMGDFCALCLYHRESGHTICKPALGLPCILYEPDNQKSCCTEYRGYCQDNGRALVEKIRNEFAEKYYRGEEEEEEIHRKEEEMENDGIRLLARAERLRKEEEERDKRIRARDGWTFVDDKEPISEPEKLVSISIDLEILKTRRAAMMTKNNERRDREMSVAYNEIAFNELIDELKELKEKLEG